MALVEVVLIKSCPFKITLYELAEIIFEFAGADQDKLITSVDGSVELANCFGSSYGPPGFQFVLALNVHLVIRLEILIRYFHS